MKRLGVETEESSYLKAYNRAADKSDEEESREEAEKVTMPNHTTIRCIIDNNDPIMVLIDDAIGIVGNTRLDVVRNVMASAMEEPIKLWFEDDVLAIQLPDGYVGLCVRQGDSYDKIVTDCVKRGLRWLENGKK